MSNADTAAVLLSFDFGLSKIGVAVGQRITQSATPLPALKARQGKPDWQLIETLINEWNIEAFVVGMPYNIDGAEQEMTVFAKKFANRLQGRFELPVHFVDERLTTKDAQSQLLRQHGKLSKIKRGDVDSYAAKLILETFLRN
ncbi:MAG: Holliday junction resolvase RuvX [Gammaproteobacteria bacterium]|nr:Holliday junction resolvase RuvX [Gammaproteobacteria bacterium]MCH9743700.1 Holliday junction resolvase RuvX [Gammaproteobacteria bacterium]